MDKTISAARIQKRVNHWVVYDDLNNPVAVYKEKKDADALRVEIDRANWIKHSQDWIEESRKKRKSSLALLAFEEIPKAQDVNIPDGAKQGLTKPVKYPPIEEFIGSKYPEQVGSPNTEVIEEETMFPPKKYPTPDGRGYPFKYQQVPWKMYDPNMPSGLPDSAEKPTGVSSSLKISADVPVISPEDASALDEIAYEMARNIEQFSKEYPETPKEIDLKQIQTDIKTEHPELSDNIVFQVAKEVRNILSEYTDITPMKYETPEEPTERVIEPHIREELPHEEKVTTRTEEQEAKERKEIPERWRTSLEESIGKEWQKTYEPSARLEQIAESNPKFYEFYYALNEQLFDYLTDLKDINKQLQYEEDILHSIRGQLKGKEQTDIWDTLEEGGKRKMEYMDSIVYEYQQRYPKSEEKRTLVAMANLLKYKIEIRNLKNIADRYIDYIGTLLPLEMTVPNIFHEDAVVKSAKKFKETQHKIYDFVTEYDTTMKKLKEAHEDFNKSLKESDWSLIEELYTRSWLCSAQVEPEEHEAEEELREELTEKKEEEEESLRGLVTKVEPEEEYNPALDKKFNELKNLYDDISDQVVRKDYPDADESFIEAEKFKYMTKYYPDEKLLEDARIDIGMTAPIEKPELYIKKEEAAPSEVSVEEEEQAHMETATEMKDRLSKQHPEWSPEQLNQSVHMELLNRAVDILRASIKEKNPEWTDRRVELEAQKQWTEVTQSIWDIKSSLQQKLNNLKNKYPGIQYDLDEPYAIKVDPAQLPPSMKKIDEQWMDWKIGLDFLAQPLPSMSKLRDDIAKEHPPGYPKGYIIEEATARMDKLQAEYNERLKERESLMHQYDFLQDDYALWWENTIAKFMDEVRPIQQTYNEQYIALLDPDRVLSPQELRRLLPRGHPLTVAEGKPRLGPPEQRMMAERAKQSPEEVLEEFKRLAPELQETLDKYFPGKAPVKKEEPISEPEIFGIEPEYVEANLKRADFVIPEFEEYIAQVNANPQAPKEVGSRFIQDTLSKYPGWRKDVDKTQSYIQIALHMFDSAGFNIIGRDVLEKKEKVLDKI